MKVPAVSIRVSLVLAMLTLGSVAAGTVAAQPATDVAKPVPGLQIGAPAVRFTLPDHDGKPFSIATLLPDPPKRKAGKVVVLIWWSATSPAVAKIDPLIGRLEREYRKAGVAFVGINPFGCSGSDRFGVECTASIRAFKRLRGLEFPILIDLDRAVTRRFRVRSVPAAVVIDTTGVVRYRGAIRSTPLSAPPGAKPVAHLDLAIRAVLAGKPVLRAEVPSTGTVIPYPENPVNAQRPGAGVRERR